MGGDDVAAVKAQMVDRYVLAGSTENRGQLRR
jgi:hypothetical protein